MLEDHPCWPGRDLGVSDRRLRALLDRGINLACTHQTAREVGALAYILASESSPPKRRSSLDESPSKPGTPGACPSFDYSSARQVSTAISSTSCPTTANRSATPRWYACRPTTRCVLVVVRSGAVGENGRGRGCLRLRRGRNRREAPAASCFPTRTEREVMTMVTGRLSVAGTGQLQSSTAISTSSSNRATVRMALILIKRAPESCNRRIRLVR